MLHRTFYHKTDIEKYLGVTLGYKYHLTRPFYQNLTLAAIHVRTIMQVDGTRVARRALPQATRYLPTYLPFHIYIYI